MRGRSGRSASSGEATGPSGTAKDRALRLLAVRWRSREEIRRRLRQAGFEPEPIEATLDDLERAGLVEDERFARELVRDQSTRRMSGERVIRAALREKGVADDVAEHALAGLREDAERAAELAARKAARMTGLEPEAAYRRLFGMLVRRGFAPDVAREATRLALREAFAGASALDEAP